MPKSLKVNRLKNVNKEKETIYPASKEKVLKVEIEKKGKEQDEMLMELRAKLSNKKYRFNDHRRSYGLEFIDIRKEIV